MSEKKIAWAWLTEQIDTDVSMKPGQMLDVIREYGRLCAEEHFIDETMGIDDRDVILRRFGESIVIAKQEGKEELRQELRCKNAENELFCECHHSLSDHRGHAHRAGGPEPCHCSQGCGCLGFRSKRHPANVLIDSLAVATQHGKDLAKAALLEKWRAANVEEWLRRQWGMSPEQFERQKEVCEALAMARAQGVELLEAAWGVIANAYGGDWELASQEWREAAVKWRDLWHEFLARGKP